MLLQMIGCGIAPPLSDRHRSPMTSLFAILRKLLRRTTFILLPLFLIVTLVAFLSTQLTELTTRSEILSLSSFITLLTFSAIAFNWCRVSPCLVPESLLSMVYQAGIDLFLGSLLALIATFFAWLQFNSSGLAPLFQPILFALHWLFLCLSLLLFIIAMFHLLHVAELTGNSQDKDKP